MMKSYNRQYAASPSFTWTNTAAIAASGQFVVSWETQDTTSQKYLPFNFTRIVNNSAVDIWFYANQNTNQAVRIPSGTIITVDRRSWPAVSSFKIVNISSTTEAAASSITVTNSREAEDADSIVTRLHRRLSGASMRGVL